MNVQETKKLILKRLDELRDAGEPKRMRPTIAEAPAHRPQSRRSRRRIFQDRRARPSSVEARLESLEERLAAIERCFVQATRGKREQVCETLEQVNSKISQVVSSSGELDSSGSEKPGREGSPQDTTVSLDFGGEPYRLTGNVKDGLITDILQMLGNNQKTGRFSLFMPERQQRFDCFYKDGEIIHAVAGEAEGEPAFFMLMTMAHQEGHYGFLEGENEGLPKTIEQKTQFMILEALRRIDEEGYENAKG